MVMSLPVVGLPDPRANISPSLLGAQLAQQIQGQQAATQAQQMKNQVMPQQLQAQLQQQLLANQMSQAKAKYAPQMAQAQLQQAQARAQMAGRSPAAATQIVQTPQGYAQVNKQTGQVSMLTDPQGKPLMGAQKGMAITSQPGGGFQITTGGVSPSLAGQGVTTSQVDPSGNVTVLPSAHSTRSMGGGTLFDPTTGNAVSVPTSQSASKFQQALTSEQLATPAITKIYNDVAPLIGSGHMMRKGLGYAGRMVGIDDPKLDAYQSALTTEIPQSADQILKSMNLNMSTDNRRAMQNTIEPRWYDTSNSYGRRMADTLAGMMMRDKSYTGYLKSAIPLQDNKDKAGLQQALSDKIYTELSHPQQAGAQSSVNIPSFQSKQQFQSWYQSLPAAQRAQVKAQLGGQ